MAYTGIAEEELKNLIAKDFFAAYDCTHIIGKIDFTVAGAKGARPVRATSGQWEDHTGDPTRTAIRTQRDASGAAFEITTGASRCAPTEDHSVDNARRSRKGVACSAPTDATTTEFQSLLWAEAKRGIVSDIYKPLVQLVLTIGRARTFDTYLPPPFLGVFDAEKIVFLPYKEIMPFFALNDFNWNVTPSDTTTREFGLLYEAIRVSLEGDLKCASVRTQRDASGAASEITTGASRCAPTDASDKTEIYLYRYDAHAEELRAFIQQHFSAKGGQIQVNKNNFVAVYQRWLATVQPSIAVDWALLKKQGIIDGDFFLADLLSEHNQTLKEALYVLLQDNRYVLDRKIDSRGLFTSSEVFFKDKQRAHAQFWSLYQRPPREEYWAYIIDRRDLLVPQDVRERKGSFFTPRQWVELSQQYIADVLGENWQEEYYVWDCAAGTGNLLNGLTNKYNIWASTLDTQDVQVMKDRIANGANLLESHVFQFDFLNDEFDCGKLPADLLAVLQNPEKRRRLIIYINPPYVEVGLARDGHGKKDVQFTKIHTRYKELLGKASRELYAQFLMRIYKEIPTAKLANFSTLKNLQAPNFSGFRDVFRAKLEKIFLVPADTFDNVDGAFPIGFMVWDSVKEDVFQSITADVYDRYGHFLERKSIWNMPPSKLINMWLNQFSIDTEQPIGFLNIKSNDFQHNNRLVLGLRDILSWGDIHRKIEKKNLRLVCIYFSVRKCIAPTWLNDRDQFLYPRDGWQTDTEFQNNSLTFTLFSNNIQSQYGTNHWIPFTEAEVNAQSLFESHFMTDFMAGRLALDEKKGNEGSLFQAQSFVPTAPLVFSPEATAVFDAGRELWRYYHAQPDANPNASYYDIRAYFQGRNDKGKMNAKSDDAEYMRLLGNLKEAMEALRQRIVPKVYEYGFLIE